MALAEAEVLLKMDTEEVTGAASRTRPKLLKAKLLMTSLRDKPSPLKRARDSPRMPLKPPLISLSPPLKVKAEEVANMTMPLLTLRKKNKRTNKP